MPEIDPVILQLRADVAKYNAEMQQTARRVDASLKLQEGSIVRLENRMTTGFERVGGAATRAQMLVGSSMNAIKGALAGVSAIALARSFLSISDEAKKLDATLKLATSGFGSFGQAQEDVRRIADDTRSGLSETASLYANFVRGAKELGGSQAEAARATETFSKTLKISGADANQAASATLQFGQALASGALRGDELNSILEASPRLARLLADAMGQPIGQIKKLGEEGKLTSDKLLRALTDTKFTAGIDDEFRTLPVTFDDAMTKVYNAALTTFSAFDKGGEFSSMLASFFTEGSDGFSGMEESAFDTGAEIRAVFAGLTDVFQPLIDAAFGAFDNIEQRANYARDSIANILRAYDNVDNLFKGVDNFGRRFDNSIKRGINEAQRRAGAGPNAAYLKESPLVAPTDKAGTFLKAFDASTRRSQGRRAEEKFRSAIGGYDVLGNPIAGAPAAGRGPAPKPVAASGSTKKTPTAPKSKLNPEAFAREEAALNDQILRLKAVDLTNADEKAKVELARIEASKLAAIKDVDTDERYTAEQKAKVTALTQTVAALEAAKVIYERDVQVAKDALDMRVAGLRNDEDLLRAQANLTTNRQERRDIELRLLDLAYQQERADLEAIVASKDATDAQKQIAKARLAMLGQLQGAEAEGINRQGESPLEARRRQVRDTATNINDAVDNIELDAVDRLTDGLADAGTEFIKLGGIAGDVLNGIIRDMIRLAAQQAIFGAAGGGGGLLGGIGSLLGISGARAAGGPVQGGKTYLVGEKGPELFRAPGSGNIVPNHELAGAAARSMVGATATPSSSRPQEITVYVREGAMFEAAVEGISQRSAVRVVRQAAPEIGAQAAKVAVQSTPAYLAKQRRFGG